MNGPQIAYFFAASDTIPECQTNEYDKKNYNFNDGVLTTCEDFNNNEFTSNANGSPTDIRHLKSTLILKDGRQITLQPDNFACFEVDPYMYKGRRTYRILSE